MNNKSKTYLGVDWGEKRIGLAIGHSETSLAMPYEVVGNIGDIIRVTREEGIDEIIVGSPLSIVDSELRNEDFVNFLEDLKNNVNIPVKTIDERLSSKAADALVGTKKTKAPRDAMAAMLILQNFLDQKNI